MKRESKLRRKLHSQSGETIGETLIALLISSLALVMLASMITSTVNLVTESGTKMNTYYEVNTELENGGSGSEMNISITPEAGTGADIEETVLYLENNTFKVSVIAYSYAG